MLPYLPEGAGIMERAIGVFIGEYLRSEGVRQTVVKNFVKEAGDWARLFSALDEEPGRSRDYVKLSKKAALFLKDRYGIKSVKDRPSPKKK